VTGDSYHGASDHSSAARAQGEDLTRLTPPPAPAGRSVYEPPRETPVHAVTDVLVVGGGPAGCAAALAARRLGAEVVLVERYNHLGGLSTGGLVIWIDRMTDWSGQQVITGIGSELLERLPAEAIAVCVAWRGNTVLDGKAPTLEDLERLSWVVPYMPDRGQVSAAPVSQQFAMLGIQPRVAVRAETYQSVADFVAGTDRIALMQERLADRVSEWFDLRVMECPGTPQTIVEALWWCEDHDDDPAHGWLRTALARVAADL